MSVTGYTINLGTATTSIVSPSADSQHIVLQNLEPISDADEYARSGYLYLVGGTVTIAGTAKALYSVATGARGMQIESYELVSSSEPIYAELIEGGTVTTTGAAIPSYNLNRDFADDATTIFKKATTVTGGSAVSTELVTGSKQGGGGGITIAKIHTLRSSTDYAFRFTNISNQSTTFFFQVIFSEKFNGQNSIWVGGDAESAFRLRGGESVSVPLIAGQPISAVAGEEAVLGVLKQD